MYNKKFIVFVHDADTNEEYDLDVLGYCKSVDEIVKIITTEVDYDEKNVTITILEL